MPEVENSVFLDIHAAESGLRPAFLGSHYKALASSRPVANRGLSSAGLERNEWLQALQRKDRVNFFNSAWNQITGNSVPGIPTPPTAGRLAVNIE